MKAKTLLLTDLLLLLSLLLVVASGLGLHWAGHQTDHELWQYRAIFHMLAALLFLSVAAFHVYGHWGWYKSLVKNGLKNKSRVTLLLTLLVLPVALSGGILLVVEEVNSALGLWHFGLGILLTVVAFGHFLKRHNLLFKGLKKSLK